MTVLGWCAIDRELDALASGVTSESVTRLIYRLECWAWWDEAAFLHLDRDPDGPVDEGLFEVRRDRAPTTGPAVYSLHEQSPFGGHGAELHYVGKAASALHTRIRAHEGKLWFEDVDLIMVVRYDDLAHMDAAGLDGNPPGASPAQRAASRTR